MQLNLDWITPQLAVGGSFPPHAVEHLARAHTVAAVVDLREEACDDASLMAAHGVDFLHLPTTDLFAVSHDNLRRGVAWTSAHLDRGARVLIHCEHGIGRSALLALCVLVARGMEPLEALELAKSKRSKVSPSQHQFEGWRRWLETHKAEARAAWEPPSFDAFGRIAYRHLAQQA